MKLRLIAAASALFLLLPTAVQANSLVEASPASGAVLGIAPNAVSITGASTLQADGNQLSVIDPKGNPVDDGSITVTDASVVVGLKPLTAAGVYTVSYTLLAAGEAPLQGSYTFLFNAPADMAAASASPTPTPTISKTGGATSSSHGAAIFVVVIFLLGCAVLLFLLWYARTLWRQTQRKKRKATKKKSAPSTRA